MLSNINLNHYRSHLGLALSEETTFEATIRENITFANSEVSDEELMWAVEKVGLYQFIKESPKGLNTILHPAGNQIPYTITRKIVLARAIVGKPKILILEDPLEQLEKSEADRIIKFLLDKSNPWALVVVSKGNDWSSGCTEIITLKEGEII